MESKDSARGINRRVDYQLSGSLLLRVLRQCNRPAEGCWEWISPVVRYPQVSCLGRVYRVHRLMYRLAVGSIPDGMLVLHRCDNKRCVRPSHMELGTAAKNIVDAWGRGLRQYNYEKTRWTQHKKS